MSRRSAAAAPAAPPRKAFIFATELGYASVTGLPQFCPTLAVSYVMVSANGTVDLTEVGTASIELAYADDRSSVTAKFQQAIRERLGDSTIVVEFLS